MEDVLSLKEAKEKLGAEGIVCTIIGDENAEFSGIASIGDASPTQAVILRAKSVREKTIALIKELSVKKVAAVITTSELAAQLKGVPMLVTSDPRLALTYLVGPEGAAEVHPTAILDQSVTLGSNVHVGPYAILGSAGLSANHHGEKIVNTPHQGDVVIGDNVTIGAHTVVVRAVMGATEIGEYSILGHGVSVGHGCKLGKRVLVAPGAVISGSCTIRSGTWIGPNVSIRENITIGEGAFIGIGSVVTRDVGDDQIVMGNPARPVERSKKPW